MFSVKDHWRPPEPPESPWKLNQQPTTTRQLLFAGRLHEPQAAGSEITRTRHQPQAMSAASSSAEPAEATSAGTTSKSLSGLFTSFVDAMAQERRSAAGPSLGERSHSAPLLRRGRIAADEEAMASAAPSKPPTPAGREAVVQVNLALLTERQRLRDEVEALKRENELLLDANAELTEESSRLSDENNDLHQKLLDALARVEEVEATNEMLRKSREKVAQGLWQTPGPEPRRYSPPKKTTPQLRRELD